jgi:hypothetical protein
MPVAASDAKNVKFFTPHELKKALNREFFAFDHKIILEKYLHDMKSCNPCKKVCSVGVK